MDKEIWKTLIYKGETFDGKYEVSNLGGIRNKKTKKPLKQFTNKKGYKSLVIRAYGRKGGCKGIRVHVAVAYNFVDGYEDGLTVDHLDGNKLNNRADNLQWVTMHENIMRAINSRGVKHAVPIRCVKTGEIFESKEKAARWCGLSSVSSINYQLKGVCKTAGAHPVTGERLTWEIV